MRMQGSDVEAKDEALKTKTAVRCAKAAFLLLALKSSRNRYVDSPSDDRPEEVELMRRKIGEMKMELARERLRSRRIKLFGVMEVVLEVAVVLCASTFLLMLALAQSR